MIDLKEIERRNLDIPPPYDRDLVAEMQLDVLSLVAEVRRLRQGLWDIYAICGGDTDGDPTPAALVSDILPLVTECARDLRACYDKEPYTPIEP
jgi:hypothetical protein